MAHPTAVLLVVGLNQNLLGEHCPRLDAFADRGTLRRLKPILPAVTCSVQSSMLTGLPPREHGIVSNGWYDRESAEVRFWKQSNHLVHGEKVWETARKRDPSVTCANLFWWFNMYSSADYSVTPKPMYKADGRKIPDCYADPPELRGSLQEQLGQFPLFNFWGPGSSIASSRWIADAARLVHERHRPTLTLVYLPHLDYALQKLGPNHADIPKALREIDDVGGGLIDYFEGNGVRVVVGSEYGIAAVDDAVHINRLLRVAGGIRVRVEEGLELLDPGASPAFAVADHQVAHVYVRAPSEIARYADFCRGWRGWNKCLTAVSKLRSASIIRAPATWCLWLSLAVGSATTTGSMTPKLPTSLAPSTSTGNPATTPWSCFWIRRFAYHSSPWAGSSSSESLASAICST